MVQDFCGEITLGGDWLYRHGTQVEFSPTVYVNGVEMPLWSTPDRSALVVVDDDIKLPPRTAVSGRGDKRASRRRSFSTDPRKYSPEKGEVALCEFALDAPDVVPIMLANQTNKTMKKGEEAGKALPLRSLQRVDSSEERSREECQVKEQKRYPL